MATQITQTKAYPERSEQKRIQQLEFRAMGSQMLAAVETDDPEAESLLAEVPRWFAEWEQTLSRFRDDSELSRLNRSAGTIMPVSGTLWEVLRLALNTSEYTGGLVTPTVLNALEATGYNTSFDNLAHGAFADPATFQRVGNIGIRNQESGISVGSRSLIPDSRYEGKGSNADTSWREVTTYSETRSVRLPHGVRLDFGGIAKGWAADEAARRLSKYGPALVNAGGDISVVNVSQEQREGELTTKGLHWLIGVDAPLGLGFAPGTQIELLSIRSGGVATSGRDYRRWQQGDEWQHHIIDPRTGRAAETDVLAATVIAPTACEAEVGAKVALLLGSKDGLEWLESHPSVVGILVLENGKMVRSPRLGKYLWSTSNGR